MIKMSVNNTIVLAANDVNLSIFKPHWLIKNEILTEDDCSGEVVVTPAFVQIPTKNFILTILPNRIQMVFSQECSDIPQNINKTLKRLITTLPHTPYNAVGLNFAYLVSPEENEGDYNFWSKKLFSSKFSNSIRFKKNSDPKFGCYFSYNVLEARLKVHVTPSKTNQETVRLNPSWKLNQDIIKIDMNFHYPVDDNNIVESSLSSLDKWTAACELSKKIADKVTI